MKFFLILTSGLHAAFMLCELFPWSLPILMKVVSRKTLDAPFTAAQQKLVATIVHNAGIYNGILAGGLLWAACMEVPEVEVARVLLAGAVVAGAFGTATLKSPVTALQAAVGIAGLFLI